MFSRKFLISPMVLSLILSLIAIGSPVYGSSNDFENEPMSASELQDIFDESASTSEVDETSRDGIQRESLDEDSDVARELGDSTSSSMGSTLGHTPEPEVNAPHPWSILPPTTADAPKKMTKSKPKKVGKAKRKVASSSKSKKPKKKPHKTKKVVSRR